MIRWIVVIVVLMGSWTIPSSNVPLVAAQEPAAECAGARWLEPLAATPEASGAAATADAESPTWLSMELTDACSGEQFTLGQFAGKTLFIESMATWCGECYGQLTRVQDAASQIPAAERNEIVLVALSSEIDLPREELARYAAKTGFPLIFAVMLEEMLKAMVADLGREFAIPPAMPHLIVAPDGTIGELHTGGSSAEELLALFAAAQDTAAP